MTLFLLYLPSKHSSWWRRTEDVFKTSWRHLQRNIFLSFKMSWRRLQDIIAIRLLEDVLKKTPCNDILKMSWRRLEDVLKTSWRRLENVLKTSWRRLWKRSCKHALKTSWRRLGKQEIFAGCSGKHIFIYWFILFYIIIFYILIYP